MATMYAKRYATEKIDSKELQKQIRENPELFASTYGQKAAKDAQVASLTLEDGRNILRKFDHLHTELKNYISCLI